MRPPSLRWQVQSSAALHGSSELSLCKAANLKCSGFRGARPFDSEVAKALGSLLCGVSGAAALLRALVRSYPWTTYRLIARRPPRQMKARVDRGQSERRSTACWRGTKMA